MELKFPGAKWEGVKLLISSNVFVMLEKIHLGNEWTTKFFFCFLSDTFHKQIKAFLKYSQVISYVI